MAVLNFPNPQLQTSYVSDGKTWNWNGEAWVLSAPTTLSGYGITDAYNTSQSLIPNSTNTYNLGSGSYRWKDLYLSGDSIYFNGIVLKEENNKLALYESDGVTPTEIVSLNNLLYKGNINASSNPNYPQAVAGNMYTVTVSGKIGGSSGANVQAGDILFCNTDSVSGDYSTVGQNWNIIQSKINTLPVSNGGTGLSSYSIGDIVYANSQTTLSKLSIGTEGAVLTSVEGVPQWVSLTDSFSSFTDTLIDISGTAPSNPSPGSMWWDSINGTLRIYYEDEDSSQWVEVINTQGQQGDAATIAIGTVTTVGPGIPASITNSGSSGAAVLDFLIPRGSQISLASPQPASRNPNQPPLITNTGTNGDVVLNFAIPRAATVSVGTTATLLPGSEATVTNTGTNGNSVLNFGIPKGAELSLGQFTVLNADQPPTLTNTGTNGNSVLNFGIPRSPTISVNAVNVLDPSQDPSIATIDENGDKIITIGVPRAAQFSLGTFTTLLPTQTPALANTGEDGDAVLNFSIPRAASVTLEPLSVLNPDQTPTLTNTGTNGDSVLTFAIPRAASVSVGTTTTLASGTNATVSNTGTNGDMVLNFGVPRGTGITSVADNNNGTITIGYGDAQTAVFNPTGYYPLTAGDEGEVLVSLGGTSTPVWASLATLLSTTDITTTDGVWDVSYTEQSGIEVKPYASGEANSLWVSDDNNSGKFYLGSQDPSKTTRMNYNGYMYATRIYNAVYNDLAEFMIVKENQHLNPGEVVSSTAEGLVRSQKGDRNVIGVYSDTFGYALGADDQQNKIPVGISGRVLVRLIGEKPYPGDLLVAGINGYAEVNNEPKIGTVIGKIFDGVQQPDGRYWMLIMNG
jgi:hypothetical protein